MENTTDKYILNEIFKKLSRYDAHNKLYTCSYLSYLSINYIQKTNETKKIQPYYKQPWTVETLILLILYSGDHKSRIRRTIFSDEWQSDINFIFKSFSNVLPPNFNELLSSGNYDSAIYSIFNQQYFYQTDLRIACFRSYQIINYSKRLHDEFLKFCGTEYLDFAFIGSLFTFLRSVGEKSEFLEEYKFYIKCINLISKIKHKCLAVLSRKKEELINIQNTVFDSQSLASFSSCFKEFSLTPFIAGDKNYYLIAPHCVTYACTDGMIKKFFYQNKDLKNTDGSEAFEAYIYKLIIDTKQYSSNEIKWGKNEKEYRVKKNFVKPEDVVFCKDRTIVFIECKINTPRSKTFVNDLESIENEKEKLAEDAYQLLKSYRNYKAGLYKPFNERVFENEYLILVTLYPIFFSTKTIINSIGKYDKQTITEDEIAFLLRHLLICDVVCLESFFIYKNDIIPTLKEYGEKEKLSDLHYSNIKTGQTSDNFNSFLSLLYNEYLKLEKLMENNNK